MKGPLELMQRDSDGGIQDPASLLQAAKSLKASGHRTRSSLWSWSIPGGWRLLGSLKVLYKPQFTTLGSQHNHPQQGVSQIHPHFIDGETEARGDNT